MRGGCSFGRLLDLDSELGSDLAPEQLVEARRRLVVRLEHVGIGRLDAHLHASPKGEPLIGLLVLRGLLAREVVLAGRVATELIGPGDLIRPGSEGDGVDLLGCNVFWTSVSSCLVAVLDGRFLRAACDWPPVMAALCNRALGRSTRLAAQRAISSLTGIELRLTMLLWQLAERWGRVTPDGVVVPLQLSHDALGRLVGAKRPSVTTALGQLVRRGVVSIRPGEGWVLPGTAPEELRPSRAGLYMVDPAAVPSRAPRQLS